MANKFMNRPYRINEKYFLCKSNKLGKPGPSDYFTNEFIYIYGFYTYANLCIL